MSESEARLGAVLPGLWRIRASNFAMWLSGKRSDPTFRYTMLREHPLRLRDEVAYRTRDGSTKRIIGTDDHDPRTGGFVWRGNGILRPLSSRWQVRALADDDRVAVIGFTKSLVTPAGIDIVTRDGVDPAELAARIENAPQEFGLSASEPATLRWW